MKQIFPLWILVSIQLDICRALAASIDMKVIYLLLLLLQNPLDVQEAASGVKSWIVLS
jgi:hypothetical protein